MVDRHDILEESLAQLRGDMKAVMEENKRMRDVLFAIAEKTNVVLNGDDDY